MKSFSNIGPATTRTRTVGFVGELDEGETIQSFSVGITLYAFSSVADATPGNVLTGACALNTEAVTIDGVVNPPGTAILQQIKGSGGQVGAEYVMRFTATRANGDALVEDVMQKITQYDPTP